MLTQRLTPGHIGLFSFTLHDIKQGVWNNNVKLTTNDDERGTFCIAQDTIEQGQVIIKENPYICQLAPEYKKKYCTNCFKPLLTSIDCRNKQCAWLNRYCSSQCEQKYWLSCHHILCRFPELLKIDVNIRFTFEAYLTNLMYKKDILPGLVSNIQLVNIDNMERMFRETFSMFYLSEKDTKALVTIYFQIKCNTFTVKKVETKRMRHLQSREFVKLGKAIYLSASKLNHACHPNSIVSFDHHQITVQCINGPIKSNQEISISYGPLITKHDKATRQSLLKDNYYFDCRCLWCTNDNDDAIYKCPSCQQGKLTQGELNCNQCGRENDWLKVNSTEDEIENYKRIHDFHKVLVLQQTIYHENTLKIGETYDRLAQQYCFDQEWKLACYYCKKSVNIIRDVYGTSIELAEEMMKLSTLLFNSYQRDEALGQIQDTLAMYKLLGLNETSPEDVQELAAMKNSILM